MKISKSIILKVALLLLSFACTFTIIELGFRLAGYKPYRVSQSDLIILEPEGSTVRASSIFGWEKTPGRFTKIYTTKKSKVPLIVTVTHLDDSSRITKPLEAYNNESPKKEIWIFGCSFTYGMLLNDEETYPWLLQEVFPEYKIVNYACSGYGTLQSYLKFKDLIEKKSKIPPAIVIVAYAGFHDERDTLSRNRRKYLKPGKQQLKNLPYARLDKDGRVIVSSCEHTYVEFPFMRYSALINFLEERHNLIEERIINNREVSRQIMMNFYNLSKKHGAKFVVAGICESSDMLNFLKEKGIKAVDVSVDLDKQGWTYWPYDSHPNAEANKIYARKLETFLRESILK